MDPFSSEGELINLYNAFFQGQYDKAAEFDISTLSSSNTVTAKAIQYRSKIAAGQAEEVLAEIDAEENTPDYSAVKALAAYTTGDTDAAVSTIEELAGSAGENATVQVVGGIVLQAAGKTEEALALLSKHTGSLEAVAITIQIRLAQNRTDLALKEVQAAKKWAQDSLLVNLAEAWVGLRVGGDKYQQSYYVFEELAQAPSTSSIRSLVAQAVSELHLGRTEEAEVALQQAMEKSSNDSTLLANMVVLAILKGEDYQDALDTLRNAAPEHPMLTDLEEKNELFDKAAGKYAAKLGA